MLLNRLLTRQTQSINNKQLTDNTGTQMCGCTNIHTHRVRIILAAPPVMSLVLYVLPGRYPGFPGVSTLLCRSVTYRILNWGQEVNTDHNLTWVDDEWDKHALKVLSGVTEGWV